MLPFRADLGAMAMKGYSAFPKAPASLEPHHQIVSCHKQDTRWGGCTPLQMWAGVFYSPNQLGKPKKWSHIVSYLSGKWILFLIFNFFQTDSFFFLRSRIMWRTGQYMIEIPHGSLFLSFEENFQSNNNCLDICLLIHLLRFSFFV